LSQALAELPGIPEGVVTLGMLDIDDGVDENYLIVSPPRFAGQFRQNFGFLLRVG
jgi:hypothetical protein